MGLQGGVGGLGMNSPTGGSSPFGATPSSVGQEQIPGAFIAGVAATSHHASIKIWNKHHRYDEWEFVGIDMGVFGIQVGTGGSSFGQSGATQQSPSQGTGFSRGPFDNPTSPTSF